MSSVESTERDPEIAELLRDAPASEDSGALDGLYEEVQGEKKASDARLIGQLRSRSTLIRRLLAAGAAIAIVVVMTVLQPRPDLADYPPLRLALEVGALSVLLLISLLLVVRPLQEPALSRLKLGILAVLAIGATVTLGLLPEVHPDAGLPAPDMPLLHHAAPCMVMGLLIGLPVYAFARILDRRGRLASLLAGAAAGLTGDVVLQMHCPISTHEHLLAGHATVVVLFLLGVAIIHLVERRLRN